MNKKQYYAVGWFFFILQFFLIWFQSTFLVPSIALVTDVLTPSAYYQLTKSAIASSMIILCMPFAILFWVLAYLENKK